MNKAFIDESEEECQDRKQRIARSFSRSASSYDMNAGMQRDAADHLLGDIKKSQAKTVLDLGCGTGYCTSILNQALPEANIICMDIAEGMLHQSRSRLDEAQNTFICGDAEALPFAKDSLDLVVSSLTIQWCENLSILFNDIFRALRPGGKLYFSSLGDSTLLELKNAWREIDNAVHVNNFIETVEVDAFLKKAGFTFLEKESNSVCRYYPEPLEVFRELKGLGAHNVNAGQPSGLTGKQKLKQLINILESSKVPGKGIGITFELFYRKLVKQEMV